MTWSRKSFFSSFVLSLTATVTFAGSAWCLPEAPPLLKEMEQLSGTRFHYSFHDGTGKVRFLAPEAGVAISRKTAAAVPSVSGKPAMAAPEAVARGFMARYGSLFGVDDQSRELTVKRARTTSDGRSFIKFQQLHHGLPVIAGELVVQTDAQNDILSIHGKASPDLQLDVTPAVGAEDAKAKALQLTAFNHKTDPSKLKVSEPVLSIYNPTLLGAGMNNNSLVWQLEVKATDLSPIREFVLIDAKRGYVALHFNQVDAALNRDVYDNGNNYYGLPGPNRVRQEGGSITGIADVDNAYDYAGDTYNYYHDNHGRDSIDTAGMKIISTVRYCEYGYDCPYQNAFWNGEQMVYGDGFASADDVVGHELTHGVTDYESGLFYYMQSGAINESLSDVFGEFIDLTNGHGTDSDAVRWKLGEDLPSSIGIIRDMKNPPLYKQPDRMKSKKYYCSSKNGTIMDNGGVHTNSGINNKAAYLMADGATFNGKTVTGLGIPKVSKIYYETQTNLLTSGSDYADLYDLLQLACQNLAGDSNSGISAGDCAQVKNAVDAVQMNQQPSCPSPDAPVCSTAGGITPVNIYYNDLESGAASWNVTGTPDVWYLTDQYATSGKNSIWGVDQVNNSDSAIQMQDAVHIPSGAYMHFKHAYEFIWGKLGATTVYPDGGMVEYSTDDGFTWTDALSLFDYNGYNSAKILKGHGNPLQGRRGFLGLSRGYKSSRLNLAKLSGLDARFRFRIGTSEYAYFNPLGWIIDDVQIYTCQMTGTISINGDAENTTKNAVTLSLTSSVPKGAGVKMQFSNDGLKWSAWESFKAKKNWNLSTGVGLKTVYTQFKHSSGAVSPVYSDSITLQ
ncbi:MAG TPA: M4 family metallopeptidase [Geobacteraceae bacterium]|nr:M4 family metallopeptidase [Geobacteraceae bacterium]